VAEARDRFANEWLRARRRFDDAALSVRVVERLIQDLDSETRPIRVVDLGCGLGAGIDRVAGWVSGPIDAWLVDHDDALLAAIQAPRDGVRIHRVRADVLAIDRPVAPSDLVVAHALADLFPLDRLAASIAGMVVPRGFAHVALTYDGETRFTPSLGTIDEEMLAAFHAFMDVPRRSNPAHGGSTAGRRVGPALAEAGMSVVAEDESWWRVGPGETTQVDGSIVAARLIDYVADAALKIDVPGATAKEWRQRRRDQLERGLLGVEVRHRDVLAVKA
jgi:SAM-dependent methyltransferase